MPKPVQASTYTLRDIIENGFLYIDKTRYVYEMVRYGKGVFFMARPRRFGKSLMISTLEEVFLGNRELFKGLWIDATDYEWQRYTIIRMDFSRMQVSNSQELKEGITRYLRQIAGQHHVALGNAPYYALFEELILKLSTEKQVVILIDEYDKPLIDNLHNLPEAIAMRDTLKGFYTLIKAMDQYIRFVFITGISKFSKVGVFSTLNHLTDLTMSPYFATALGITEEEIDENLQEHVAAFASRLGIEEEALRIQMHSWYNGFCFVEGCPSVYNPFSTLQLFYQQRFTNYWFETGTPTFLIKLLTDSNYPISALEDLMLKEIDFSTYELEQLDVIPLLFQTGYLTIKGYQQRIGEETIYHLSYPNREVENAFTTYLLSAFTQTERTLSRSHLYKLIAALKQRNLEQMFQVLRTFFANVPYTLKVDAEAWYQTIFYIVFKMIGIETEAEVVTNDGRIDAVVALPNQIYLFEFKLDGTAEAALAQIKQKEYFQKYWLSGKPILCVGANFETEKRTVTTWLSEECSA